MKQFLLKSLGLGLSLSFLCVIASAQVLSDSTQTTIVNDSILTVQNLNRLKDTTQINDVIVIQIKTSKAETAFTTLYINGIRLDGLKPFKQSVCSEADIKTVFFKLDQHFYNLVNSFSSNQPSSSKLISMTISIGDQKECLITYSRPFLVEIRPRINYIWILIISVVCIAITGLALWNNILKDDNNFYYSLGRTQLFYWTLLFVIAYLYVCSNTGTLPELSSSILAILGISAGTTAMSKVIENKNKDVRPIDAEAKSEGWFLDILSDGSSINIQRFQNVILNVVFGVVFIQRAITFKVIPDFDQNVLMLLGISSFTYAGLKITEATKEQAKALPQVNSETTT